MTHPLEQWFAERGRSWLADLETEFKIHVSRDGDLVSLKYDQIESPMDHPLVRTLRGMVVLDAERPVILAHPYDKFWNHGEGKAAAIDWSTARVLDKLDGSLAILYAHENEWRWASSGHPTAGGSYGDTERTFRQEFESAFRTTGMRYPEPESVRWCFMFEFIAPDNRIVCKYDRPMMVLHGARDRVTHQEATWSQLQQMSDEHDWPLVGSHEMGTATDALAAAEALDPVKAEGFVVVDGAFNRVKIKSPRYVALHHLRGEASPRRAIELWQAGEVDELLAHFPELSGQVVPICEALDRAAASAWADYSAHRHLPTRKEFALAVKDAPWSGVTFLLCKETEPSPEAATRILRGLLTGSIERMLDRL